MAINLTLQNVSTLQNSSIVAAINANNVLIETGFTNCLSRAGTSPNQMQSNMDLNNFQILNLPAPGSLNSPVRLIDLQNATIGSFGTGIYGLLAGVNTWTNTNTFSGTVNINSTFNLSAIASFTNTTQSSSTTTGGVVISGGLGIAKNLNVGGTFSVGTVVGTGVTTITINNLGGTFPTTGSDGIVLQNTTAATALVPVQISPDIRFSGMAWNTTSTTSQQIDWIMATVPLNGSIPFGRLSFGCQVNGGGYNFIANFYSATNTQALFIGDNSNNAQIVLAGKGSGSANGALITVQNGANTNVFLLGNKSSAFGGAYDGTPVIYANPVGGSSNPLQFFYTSVSNISVSIGASATNATSLTTGTLIVTGGVGISGTLYSGTHTIVSSATSLITPQVTVPAPTAGTLLQLVQADGTSPGLQLDGIGSVAPALTFELTQGTTGSPAALSAGAAIGSILAKGYDGTSYTGNAAALKIIASGNWVHSTSTGASFQFNTTPSGSTTRALAMSVYAGVAIGASGTDPGSGNLAASGTITGSTLYATGDAGGVASTNALSNISSTTISTGVGSVKMSSVNAANNAVWVKVYAGTTAYWVPGWTTNSP
jgi:hypothetical protein